MSVLIAPTAGVCTVPSGQTRSRTVKRWLVIRRPDAALFLPTVFAFVRRSHSGAQASFAVARGASDESLIESGPSVLWSAWPHTRPKWESNSVFLLYEYLLLSLRGLAFIQNASPRKMSSNRSLECAVDVRPPYRIASEKKIFFYRYNLLIPEFFKYCIRIKK